MNDILFTNKKRRVIDNMNVTKTKYMKLTPVEKNVVLVALDHMREHLFEIYDDAMIDEELYNSRVAACDSIREKI